MWNQKHIDHTIAFINNKIHKYTIIWRKNQRTLLMVMKERITTQLSDLASSSQCRSPLHLMNKQITQQCNVSSHHQTNNTSLQNTKFQPLDLSDEGSIYRCLARVRVSSRFLISVIPLIVLGSTWGFHDLLLIPGWIHRGKCCKRCFWKIPWSSTLQTVSAICLFSLIAPYRRAFQYASHLLCVAGEMHRTLSM